MRLCGCGAKVRGRCLACERRTNRARGSSHARGYDWSWRKPGGIREQHLRREPLCRFCLPTVTQATDVDHIDGNPRNNADSNLRSLCHACHSGRTARDQSGWGR